jgi:hypothetical protein
MEAAGATPAGEDLNLVKVVLKIREGERIIFVREEETFSSIQGKEFPGESVRFICRGRELSDASSVAEARPAAAVPGDPRPDTIVHCVVRSGTGAVPPGGAAVSPSETADATGAGGRGAGNGLVIDSCGFLQLILGVIFLLLWMLYFSITELFERSSVVMLTSLTVGYALFVISYKTLGQRQRPAAPTATAAAAAVAAAAPSREGGSDTPARPAAAPVVTM